MLGRTGMTTSKWKLSCRVPPASHQLPLTIPSDGRRRRAADWGQQWVQPAFNITAGKAKRRHSCPSEASKGPRNFASNLLRI